MSDNPFELPLVLVGVFFAIISLLILSVVLIGKWVKWKQGKIWAQMTPEQRLAIRSGQMADALRERR